MTSYIRKPKDFISGAIFLVVGVGALILLQDYQFGTARRMGPAYFPAILAAMLSCFAVVLIWRSLGGTREAMESVPMKPALLILGGALLFALLIRPAGLVLAVVPMVFLGSLANTPFRWQVALPTGIVLALGSAAIFAYGLGQPIPVLGYWFGN